MTETRRPHTGRRRNEAARESILEAALRLLTGSGGDPVSVDTLAAEAGVGKQTIYRWWPSKGAVFLEALDRNARGIVPEPDTGTLRGDLTDFLDRTFEATADPTNVALLRTLAAEAVTGEHSAALLAEFADHRRTVLHTLLQRGAERGEVVEGTDLDLMIDQVYGLLWYRVLLRHRPYQPGLGALLTATLLDGVAAEPGEG